jgi:hypothetical protein
MSAGTPQTPTAVLPKGFQYGYATGEFCCMTAEHTYEYIVFQRLMLHAVPKRMAEVPACGMTLLPSPVPSTTALLVKPRSTATISGATT